MNGKAVSTPCSLLKSFFPKTVFLFDPSPKTIPHYFDKISVPLRNPRFLKKNTCIPEPCPYNINNMVNSVTTRSIVLGLIGLTLLLRR
jgi:hypothetical protein